MGYWFGTLRKRLDDIVEHVAEALGTVTFLAVALTLIGIWVALNGGYAFFSHAWVDVLHGRSFDPAPWILLNLIFSFEAFFTGSLVIIAQKAQAKRDHSRQEANAQHREELAQATHAHILRVEFLLLEHMQRIEALLGASQPLRDEEGDDGSSPPPAVF